MIGIAVGTTTYFAVHQLESDEVSAPAPGYQAVNRESYWSMVGYAFYMYEGIGSLLPIMRETEKPENFVVTAVFAMFTILLVQVSFASLCYYTWGNEIVEPIITEILPENSTFVQVMKLLYIVNLIYSYRIVVAPALNCLDTFVLKIKETDRDED